MEKRGPEYVDKGELSPEKLVEIYSDFGLMMEYDEKPEMQVSDLEDRFGDVTNEVLYLSKIGAVEYRDDSHIKLGASERSIANRMNQRIVWESERPSEVVENGALPDYLKEPEMSEEYREAIDSVDQRFNEEIYTRMVEILVDEALEPEGVEDELVGEINFDPETRLRIMERKGSAVGKADGTYELVPERIGDHFFGEEMTSESLRSEQWHDNNPWKP